MYITSHNHTYCYYNVYMYSYYITKIYPNYKVANSRGTSHLIIRVYVQTVVD